MIYILPLFISFLTGFLIIRLLFSKETVASYLTQIFLSLTLGLGISGLIGWSCLWFFDQFYPIYGIVIHLFLLLTLFLWHIKNKSLPYIVLKNAFSRQDYIILFLLCFILIPLIIFSFSYPFGGWDAWAMWNVKAKFIFLGKSFWKNMFDPILLHTNTDYPFLLPLINCWFWSFHGSVDFLAPRLVSMTIPIIISGVLMSSLKTLQKTYFYVFAALWIFLNDTTLISSISQYSDQILSLFLLSSFICFTFFYRTKQMAFLGLAGVFTGLMTFTKNEGLVLSLLIVLCSSLWLVIRPVSFQDKKKSLLIFIGWVFLFSLPWLLFKIFWCPQASRFINGLLSHESPTTFSRLLIVLFLYIKEIFHIKWAGFWLVSCLMALAYFKQSFRREIVLIPTVCGLYILILLGIYYINTNFEVIWWIQTSLNRTLSVLVPSATFWVFSSIDEQ